MSDVVRSRLLFMLFSMVMGATVAFLTGHREAFTTVMIGGWAGSIMSSENMQPISVRRMLLGVSAMGIVLYALCRFVFA